jgi:tRNA-specific 2-thiouridylase
VPVPARWRRVGDGARVEFAAPEEAVAPGPACVAYDGSRVLGGGFIARERAAA